MVSNITRFTLRISKTLDDKMSALAQEEQTSKNALIVKACKRMIDMYQFEERPKSEVSK